MTTYTEFLTSLRGGAKVAGFGSRSTPKPVLDLMTRFASAAVTAGGVIASGHCLGADLAFETGACSVNPASFHRCLPWASYNSNITVPGGKGCAVTVLADLPAQERVAIATEAAKHHPVWERLSNGVQLLHGRNILIGHNAMYGVCYTKNGRGGGGTGQCIRYLKSLDVAVCDLGDPVALAKLTNLVTRLEKEVF